MKPILSVCMISYNHENFIEEAIGGIINQKTSFPFELVICDDASSDITNEKILKITKNLPEHITLKHFSHQPNLGMIPNFEFALNACSGKYISVCEGDDYWVDNNKLQKQVEYLEANPNYNILTGYVRQYFEGTGEFVEPHNTKPFTFDYKDMIVKNHCTTCTTTFRNFITKDKPLKLIPELEGDFQVWMRALGKTGKAMKCNEVLAVYRRHENSATGVRNKKLISYRFFVKMVNDKISNAETWNHLFGDEADIFVMKLKVNSYKKLAEMPYSRKILGSYLLYNFYFWKYRILVKLKTIA